MVFDDSTPRVENRDFEGTEGVARQKYSGLYLELQVQDQALPLVESGSKYLGVFPDEHLSEGFDFVPLLETQVKRVFPSIQKLFHCRMILLSFH